jgi:hypothetical protein
MALSTLPPIRVTHERRSDGSPMLIEGDYVVSTMPMPDHGHFGIQRNISERASEEALRESEENSPRRSALLPSR